jgi:hypothetical protein
MNLDDFIKQLEKTKSSTDGFDFCLGGKLEFESLSTFEKRNEIEIPLKIKEFMLVANGLKTFNPDFEIIDFNSWEFRDRFIHFATFDKKHKIVFDTRKLNSANEWTILNEKDNYEITLTISSFWSNKIWHWLQQRHEIWTDNWWTK